MMTRRARLILPTLGGTGLFGDLVVRWALPLVLGGMACLLACAAVCLYVVRLSVPVRAAGVLEPGSSRNVYSPGTGLIEAVRIRPGDSVAQGDVLAILVVSPQGKQIDTLQTRVEIRSPSDGTVLTEHVSDRAGRSISHGELVCQVGILTDWNVDAFTAPGDLRRVREGDAAMVAVPALTPLGALIEEAFPGQVVFIRSESSNSKPHAALRHQVRVRLDSAGIEPGRLRGLRCGVPATLRITARRVRAIDLLFDYLREHGGTTQ